MTDHDDPPLPDWAVNLQAPPPVDEAFRLMLVAMEIARFRDNYAADNPPPQQNEGVRLTDEKL